MAKLSVSVDVPLPPEKAWECASDLSRYKDWLSIHRVWRSKLPETLEKGRVDVHTRCTSWRARIVRPDRHGGRRRAQERYPPVAKPVQNPVRPGGLTPRLRTVGVRRWRRA